MKLRTRGRTKYDFRQLADYSTSNMDANMITMFNALERTEEEWKEIFALADARFGVVGVRNPKAEEGNLFAIVETVWKA